MTRLFRILISILVISFSSTAYAEDINGTWAFDYGYNMTFSGSGGSFSGTGGEGSSYTWVITNGVLSGNSVSWKESYNEITYLVDRQGTISGNTMSGTWTSSWGQNGNWTATRISGGGGTGGGNNGGGSSTKRPTAINLFCNRTGVGLSTADCAATVADAGAPPRMTPSGTIDFVATNGFFPGAAQCFPTQTPYSPGIASCRVQFSVPFGFPLGAAFPIDATYSGDSNFSPSSTSHTLIQAGCVGTPEKPCSGAVALAFADFPQILKNSISSFIVCGKNKTAKALKTASAELTGNCETQVKLSQDLIEMIQKLSASQLQTAVEALKVTNSQSEAEQLTIFRLQSLVQLQQAQLEILLKNKEKLQEVLEKGVEILKATSSQAKRKPKAKPILTLSVGSVETTVGNNKQKKVNIKLTPFARVIINAFKLGGLDQFEPTFTVVSKRTGSKRSKKTKQVFPVFIN